MTIARSATHAVGSAVLAFLVLPLLAVVPASFNHASFIKLPPDQVSLRWYTQFFHDSEWLHSLSTSLQVALLATLFSVVIGTLAAIGMEMLSGRWRALFFGIVLSPLIVPVIMTSVAIYYIARPLGLHGTLVGLALAHTLLALPFVVINVGLALRGIDQNCHRAAAVLGASPWRIFRTVTLPLITPGLAGAAAFSFITSFDEVVMSIFLSGVQAKTLPVKIWEVMRVEFTPVTAVASTLLLVVTVVMFAVVQILRARNAAAAGKN
jgi:putative spermidine/putrescine transport system permease protein